MTTIEGNKLIFDFMGDIGPNERSISFGGYYQDMKYYSSWDWLKPVIDRIIEVIGVKSIDECTEREWIVITNLSRMYIGVSIDQAWRYVIDFLEWYNNNEDRV